MSTRFRLVEKRTRDLRRENDCLIKEQKRLKDEIAVTDSRARELEDGTVAAVDDLKQQIVELEFYLRSQQKLGGLEMQDEMQDSSLVIVNNKTESTTPPNPKKVPRKGKRG